MWPAKLQVVTIYPFRERASAALRRIGRMQDSQRSWPAEGETLVKWGVGRRKDEMEVR